MNIAVSLLLFIYKVYLSKATYQDILNLVNEANTFKDMPGSSKWDYVKSKLDLVISIYGEQFIKGLVEIILSRIKSA